jgi:hypothetical protein
MRTDDKYIVFKREDWEEDLLPYVGQQKARGYPVPLPEEVDDAVVMRRQDIFAAPAFRLYAATISASLVVAAKIVAPGMVISNSTLEGIALYFDGQAELSEQEIRKVPD